jgi:hypothetical protein
VELSEKMEGGVSRFGKMGRGAAAGWSLASHEV